MNNSNTSLNLNKEEKFDFGNVFDVDDYLYFYSDMLPEEKSDSEVEFLINKLDIKPSYRILDLPCGYGRHSNRLSRYGCNVTGIDIMEGFIKIAQKIAQEMRVKPEYIVGDLRDIKYKESFDIVLSLFTSFGYFDDQTNMNILKNIRRALKKGGIFCIDTINRDTLLHFFRGCILHEKGDDYMIDKNRFDYEKGRVYTRRIVFRDNNLRIKDFFIRVYNPNELRLLLESAGFKLMGLYAGLTENPPASGSMRIMAVAQK